MLQGLIISALAILLLDGCSSSGAGRRSGSVSMFGAGHAFGDLDLTVGASKMVDRPMEITAQLSRPERSTDRNPDCFVAAEDLRVTVDGQPLELYYSGGKSRPTMISGVEVQLSRCAPAIFRSRADSVFDDRVESVIVVEGAGRRAEAKTKHLLARRQLQIQPSNQVHPGDRVTLVWTPTEDEWSGYDKSTSVHVYYPDDFSVSLERNKLEIDLPRFSFVLPNVRPGPAKVGLSTTYLEAHPNVLTCEGLNSCYAVAHNGPAEVEITVESR